MNIFKKRVKRNTMSDNIIDGIFLVIFILLVFFTLYPLYFVLIASFSDPMRVATGDAWLWINTLYLRGYEAIFTDPRIWVGYRNTFLYVITGTVLALSLTLPAGYALSRQCLRGRKYIMLIFIFTMYFNGGLIPTFLLIRDLNMMNTLWVMIVPLSVNVFNLIIIRTFFQNTLPAEILESAQMDGCSNTRFFFQFALPLSKALIAVITLFLVAIRWNSWFPALLYLTETDRHPLQLVLREIFFGAATRDMMDAVGLVPGDADAIGLAASIRYGAIVVSTLPVMLFYPFIQKYFTQGVMIGSVKG